MKRRSYFSTKCARNVVESLTKTQKSTKAMKKLGIALAGVCVMAIHSQAAMIPLGMNAPYVQNFNTLAGSGTSSVVPNGWAFAESGTGANTTYTASAGQGSAPPADTYSFGGDGTTDRAFGTYRGSSDSFSPIIGANFQNTSGSAITRLTIAYVGEEWRLGANNRTDRLDFQYSLNATSLTDPSATWIDANNLDFVTPSTKGKLGGTDGNQSKFQTAVGGSVSFLNIPNGQSFWIRWTDFNVAGADDGLAVDDFSIVAVPEASTYFAGLALLTGLASNRKRNRRIPVSSRFAA
jgi:hypothetical protein